LLLFLQANSPFAMAPALISLKRLAACFAPEKRRSGSSGLNDRDGRWLRGAVTTPVDPGQCRDS
jgi:hypothetical protein